MRIHPLRPPGYLNPKLDLDKGDAHAAFIASSTREMVVSKDLIQKLIGQREGVAEGKGEEEEEGTTIQISLPPSTRKIPRHSVIREVDLS